MNPPAIDNPPRLAIVASAVLLALGVLAAGPARAVAVGGPEVLSKIGQPLKVRIPLSLQPDEELSADCLRPVSPRGDDAPAVSGPRLAFDSLPRPSAVLLTTRSAVAEPAVRFALQVGCNSPITKEFVVLLELPGADDLQVPLLPAVPTAAEPRPASRPGARTDAPAVASAAATPDAADQPAPAAKPRASRRTSRASGTSAPAASANRPVRKRPAASAPAAAGGDRLRLTPTMELGLAGGDLKLSSELRMSSVAILSTGPDAARAADPAAAHRLAIEQARLAAFLRDEDPVAATIAKEKELAARLGQIGGELEKARSELSRAEAAKPAAAAVPKTPAPAAPVREEPGFLERWWAALLAGGAVVLGVALIALATLRRKRQTDQWWAAVP
ncbi:MAG TPA: hypothetical protein VFK82_08420, partial [Burkholderiaceae bacterium]|nr:hypothetical protein [Burkholderiaceae bacterium]